MAKCMICGWTQNRTGAKFCVNCGGRLTFLKPGEVLHERYKIVRLLGKGGMGAVCLAEDMQAFGKQCVVKELIDYFNPSDPDEVKKAQNRFEEEARTLARLDHPAIPDVRDYFSDGGRNYMVMEYVEGENLQDRLQRERKPLPQNEVLPYAIQVCRILEYLSAQNPPLVHHDIKPANIIVNREANTVALVDFGTAKVRLVPGGGKLGQGQSSVYGTVGYAPPEQYGDKPQTEPRSDVYALAATLYHLLTYDDPGDHPMDFPRLSALPADMGRVLERALDNDVQQRMGATDLRQALEKILASSTVQPYVFPSGGRAHSAEALAHLCDKDWQDAKELLFRGSFEPWLRTNLFRSDLAQQATRLAGQRDKDAALEEFSHLLDPDLPAPKPTVDPAMLSFGHVKADKRVSKQFRIRNASSRGHLSGKVTIAPQVEWLGMSATSFSGNDVSMTVTVDTTGRAQGARLTATLQVETPYAPTVNVPVKARVALAWTAFLGTLLLYILIGGLLSWGASLLVGQITLYGLNDDLWMYLMGLGLLVTLCGGLAAGKALAEPGGFAGLGLMLGMGFGLPGFAYLFLTMLAEFQSLRSVGGDALAYRGTFAMGAFVTLLLGLFGSLRKVRRKVLAVLVPTLMMGVLATWIVKDPSIALMQTPYTVMDREIPIIYVSAVSGSRPMPTPVAVDDLLPVPIVPAATHTPTPRPTHTPTPIPLVIPEEGRIRVGIEVRVIKTRGQTLRIRAEADINAKTLTGAPEGSVLEVIGGPKTANGYTWWQVKRDSTVGWAAQDWLEPLR